MRPLDEETVILAVDEMRPGAGTPRVQAILDSGAWLRPRRAPPVVVIVIVYVNVDAHVIVAEHVNGNVHVAVIAHVDEERRCTEQRLGA